MSAPSAGVPLLSVRGLSKSFPGQQALRDVALDVHSGEIVAVVGQNGSGKSTLVKVLTGVYEPDAGSEITMRQADGQRAVGPAAQREIHVIHQDLGLVGMLSTVENLDLADGTTRALRPTRPRRERQHARSLIGRFGAEFDVTARVDTLTPAQRTIVAIGRALDGWSRPEQILLLDEPTASLPDHEVARLFRAVGRAADDGAGVVFISHRLDEVLHIADRVVALRGGTVVADVPTGQLDRHGLVRLIAGRDLTETKHTAGGDGQDAVLSVRGLSGAGVRTADLDVRAGEVLGVCGIIGSGREQLASLIFGGTARTAGQVLVAGAFLRADSPRHAVAAGVGHVPADRHADGAVMAMRARENLTLAGLRPLRGRLGWLNSRAERRTAGDWTRRVELDPPDPERPLELFSGGNQQKVVLAKWLRNKPKVLLLDEPTQGVDVGAKAAIYTLIRAAAAGGAGVLVASSDTAELSLLCDRVVVLRDGVITANLERAVLTEARLVTESLAVPSRPTSGRTHTSEGLVDVR